MNAFIIVDLQNDFLTNGKLEIKNSSFLVDKINKKALSLNKKEWITITTMDYHPFNHCSFLKHGGKWLNHCIRFTNGSRLHKDLIKCDYNIKKGFKRNSDSYSGFYVSKNKKSKLNKILKQNKINKIYVCGLAFDVCVYNTCLDARKLGYEVYAISDLSKSVDQKALQQTIDLYIKNKINVI